MQPHKTYLELGRDRFMATGLDKFIVFSSYSQILSCYHMLASGGFINIKAGIC